jgi:hypothetical protein
LPFTGELTLPWFALLQQSQSRSFSSRRAPKWRSSACSAARTHLLAAVSLLSRSHQRANRIAVLGLHCSLHVPTVWQLLVTLIAGARIRLFT